MINLERFDRIAPAIWTSLPPEERGAPYDKMAAGYDRIVGNGVYNQLVWGCAKANYTKAASDFLAQVSAGPILDAGCGSCVFTADAYRGHEDRLILLDRSLGMLSRAKARLPEGRYLQGDALALPFEAGSFAGVMGWGMLHIFGTGAPYLAELARVVTPGALVTIATLVETEPRIGNMMLRLLHRNGEAAKPEGNGVVMAAFAVHFDLVSSERFGNMLFLTGRKRSI
jgi:ubiquinone/menaquinone biosynthesis C-methylase UbiE